MSNKDSFQKLQSLPCICGQSIPKPLIYPKHSNSVIISISYLENIQNNAGIFKYNLIKNTMEFLYKYDDTIRCREHGQFIVRDSLFVFGGETDSFFTFNLNTKSIKTDN
eukprot:514025_1